MARTKKKALFIDTEATYGVDPSASGAGYAWAPTLAIGLRADKREPLETNYQTGRNFDTAPIQGPDGWELSGVEFPLIGLSAAAGDGTNASSVTDDWLDAVLTHIFGSQDTTPGEGVLSVASATAITFDGDVYDVQDLLPVYEASVPATPRTQWNLVTVDPADNSYTIAPGFSDFGTVPPTGAAIGYGVKAYLPTDNGGASLAFVYREDDVDYTLLGARCTSAQITFEAGKIARLVTSWRGDSSTQETKGSLPSVGAAPANTPIRGLVSPVWFNGTAYQTRSVTIDLGITAAVQEATSGSHGRGDDQSISILPMVTIEPLRTDAILELKRAATAGRLLVQLGGGILSGGVLNTMAFHAAEAVAIAADPTDENGRIRQSVQFKITDPVTASSAAARVFQLARA